MLIFRHDRNRKMIERQESSGKLLRLASGIYTSNTETSPDMQVRQNLVKILAYLRPDSVISHRSAIRNDFGAESGVIILTHPEISQNYQHALPGLTVLVTQGPGPLPGDSDIGGVYVSSAYRAALENYEVPRPIRSIDSAKQASREEIDTYISKRIRTCDAATGFIHGIDLVVNAAGKWRKEQSLVLDFIAEHQAKESAHPLHLSPLIDHPRIVLFENLAQQLKRKFHGNELLYGANLASFPSRPDISDPRFLNLAFYESYFSNYIEGTEFAPEEAHDIVTDERSAAAGTKDGHDITALYRLYANPEMFLRADGSPDEFITNLKYWHYQFASGHPDKSSILPGQFKHRANRAGSTWFTDPAQVDGTLRVAWEIGNTLDEPIDQAIFRALSTVSIHPFLDGNGRITRLASSNILGRHGKMRIMIPNVFREDYILAIRAFSAGDPIPAIRMFRRAAELTRSVPFNEDFRSLTQWLHARHAFSAPEEAKWTNPITDIQEDEGFAPS